MKSTVVDPIDQLNQLMSSSPDEGTAGERWRRYFEPVPGLSKGLPVPILGIMVLIWQLREPDLQQRFSLADEGSRMDFVAWCLVHGGREYQALREADVFWAALGQPAAFPGAALAEDDPGQAISWLMVLLLRERSDLSIDLSNRAGRNKLLAWFVLHGQLELSFVTRPFQPWQTTWLFAGSGQPGLNRLHTLVYDALAEVRTAFPLPAERTRYLAWLQKFLCVDTKLVANLCAQWSPANKEATQAAMPPQSSPEGVNVLGYVFGQLGIGEDARMAAKSLRAAKIPFTMVDFPPGIEIPKDDRSMAEHVVSEPVYSTNVFCLTALEQGRYFAERGLKSVAGRYNIGYWPWELPRFPAQWNHLQSLVNEVWASTRHVQQGLQDVSRVPVHVMPLAVEMTEVSSKKRRDFGLPAKAKLFIFSFDLNSSAKRKNPMACLEAFRRAFPLKGKDALGPDQVGLVIKVHRPTQPNADWEMLKRLQAHDPRIHLIQQTLSKADLMALYKACDCFISLHRAEGFGRGIAEAMLLGKPVIATGFSGNLEFTREDNSLLVSHELLPLLPGDYVYGAGQSWADPDLDHAAAHMRLVLQDKKKVDRLASKGQQTIADEHDIHGVGKRYEAQLRKQGRLVSKTRRRTALTA